MRTYGRINGGLLVEIIEPVTYVDVGDVYDPATGEMVPVSVGDEISINRRYTPEFVETLVDITSVVPLPTIGEQYAGGVFTPATAAHGGYPPN